MRKGRSLVWFVIVVLVLSAGAIALSLAGPDGKGPLPIEFRWKSGGEFEKKVAAHIENANAMLSTLFAQIREDPKSPELRQMIDDFQSTYLRHPKLHLDGGIVRSGWDEVLAALVRIVRESSYVSPHGVMVELEYVPYDLETKTDPRSDLDFKIRIKTVLGIYPNLDPILEGGLCHRRICEVVPCDPDI